MGSVMALHSAPRSFLPMRSFSELNLIADVGIEGDRYASGEGFYSDRPEPGRQITLFEMETLEGVDRDHGVSLEPGDHRRNVTTRDVALNHLVGKRFSVGGTVLLGTRLATPCRHIEQITGKEFFNQWLHRCGLHAQILVGGLIRVGDKIERLD